MIYLACIGFMGNVGLMVGSDGLSGAIIAGMFAGLSLAYIIEETIRMVKK